MADNNTATIQAPDPSTLAQDKDFQSFSPDDQRAYLSHVYPDFASMSKDDQDGYMAHILGQDKVSNPTATAPVKQGIVNPAAPDPFGMAAQMNPGSISYVTGALKTVAPYAGAELATSGLGTAIPLLSKAPLAIQALSRMAAAAGGGSLAQMTTNIASRRPLFENVPKTAAIQGLFQGLGETSSAAYKFGADFIKKVNTLENAGAAPEEVLNYISKNFGSYLTSGERLGAGATATTENVLASHVMGQGPATDFIAKRDPVVKAAADKLSDGIITTTLPAINSINANSGDQLVKAAQEVFPELTSGRQIEQTRLAQAAAGQLAITPGDFGDELIKAVRGQYDTAKELESQQYAITQGTRDATTVSSPVTMSAAQSLIKQADAAARAGGAIPDAEKEIYSRLQTLAGGEQKNELAQSLFGLDYDKLNPTIQAHIDQQSANVPKTDPFQAFWDARKQFGQLIGRLNSQGIIDGEKRAALDKVYDAMTTDMMNSLPVQARGPFQSALAMTKSRQQTFGSDMIQSMLDNHNTINGEKIISTIFSKGNETDGPNLLRIVGNNPAARQTLAESAGSYLTKFGDAKDALQMLQDRPFLKTLLGPGDYSKVQSELATRAIAEITPQEKAYQSFISNLAGGEDQDTIIKRAISSPTYAANIDRLSAGNPAIRSSLSTDMLNHILNDATSKGQFGQPGTETDWAKIYNSLQDNKESLSKFFPVDPATKASTIDNLSVFAKQSGVKQSIDDLVQKSTVGGDPTDPFAKFSPPKFAANWSKERADLIHLLPTDKIEQIDKFAQAARYMTFGANPASVAGKLGTLQTIQTGLNNLVGLGGAAASTMGVLAAGGDQVVSGLGGIAGGVVSNAIANIVEKFGLRSTLKFLISPEGSQLMAEGWKVPSAEARGYAVRMTALLGQMAGKGIRSIGDSGQSDQPSNAINPVIPSSSNTQPLRPGQ